MRALVLLFTFCFGAGAALAEPVFPPGSRIGLTPPSDMAVSKRFTGFENPGKMASITLAEMPADAYPQLTAGLTKEALQKQGVTVTAREELTIAGKPAVLIAGDQTRPVKLRRWVVAINAADSTAFVIAQAGTAQRGYTDKEIRDALTSIALRPPLPVEEQMAALPFRLGDRAGFRPVRVLSGNALLMTDGPNDTIRQVEQPIVIVATGSGAVPSTDEARERLGRAALFANQSLRDFAIERSQVFRLGGVDWHEMVARAKDAASGEPVVVMQTIRFAPGGYLRMVGITRAEGREAALPRFRAVIDSVTLNGS